MTKKMSALSFFSLHLELYRNAKKIGSGTGFIYRHEPSDRTFLITNYHVLTCRYPKDPSLLLPGYPDSPDEVAFYVLSRDGIGPKQGSVTIDSGTKWIEHKRRSDGVDIVALPLEFPDDANIITQNKLDLDDEIDIEAGSDLFIIGFPFGFGAGNYFPIWKRGTVASEPLFNIEGIAQFYIDSYTHPGMSGSPVFAVEWKDKILVDRETANLLNESRQGKVSSMDFLNRIDSNILKTVRRTQCFRLVGIYSGRVTVGTKDPNIGIVWQRSLIDELFLDPIVADHPYPPT